MTEPGSVRYRTGAIWGVLAVLLLIGTVGLAFSVYSVTDLVAHHRYWVDIPFLVGGSLVAVVSFLLLTGVLYRIDRLRGIPTRRVRLFD